ncbi:MAG: SDR family NAD(P)-dependent oxidoreductase [Pseudomonadota bacterium]
MYLHNYRAIGSVYQMTQADVSWTVITGSTGGIASEIVKLLASRGDAMVFVNRTLEEADLQRDQIKADYPSAQVEIVIADLMETAQIAEAGERINALPGKVRALYNNAGILTSKKILNSRGLESHFAVNTLAPYQLIKALKQKMARTTEQTPAMVVNFASSAVFRPKALELGSLVNPESVGGLMSTYAQSKLAVTALADALAEELKADNILIRAIDPGATKSPMTTGGNSGMPTFIAWLAPLLFSPASKQAVKIVEAADPSAFGGSTGIFVANRREKTMPRTATDPETQRGLIELLDRLLS